jgi:hypothetical protein
MKHFLFAASILLAGATLMAASRPVAAQIIIDNLADLENINNNPSGDYVLGVDINAGGFTPIPDFSGTLNGNGYVINNLSISTQSPGQTLGLFGDLSGTVENLGLTNVNIVSGPGATVGGIAGFSDGTITRSYSTGAERVGFGSTAGGLAGYSGATISQSFSTTTVNSDFGRRLMPLLPVRSTSCS